MASLDQSLHYQSLATVAEGIRTHRLSPLDVTRHLLERIAALDRTLHAYVAVTADAALAAAERAEGEIARGHYRGPLHGVPIALKDNICTEDAPTSCGSTFLADIMPLRDAAVVARLRGAGAVLLGKLALAEGAFADHRADRPPPVNPWNSDCWAGLSSSGSAVATAAGLCFASLGTDTGGSLRLPAAACGLSALKPSWGRISCEGVFPLCPSLDHVGPLARDVADVGLLFEALAGEGARPPAQTAGLRIGFDPSLLDKGCEAAVVAAVDQAVTVFRELGYDCREIGLPDLSVGQHSTRALFLAELAAVHAPHFPIRADDYGPALRQMLVLARQIELTELSEAWLARQRLGYRISALLTDVDLILLPTMPGTTRSVEETARLLDPDTAGPLSLVSFTRPFNESGHPVLAFCGGFAGDGMPIGLQLVGQHFAEAMLLGVGKTYQQATDWHGRHPTWPGQSDSSRCDRRS